MENENDKKIEENQPFEENVESKKVVENNETKELSVEDKL